MGQEIQVADTMVLLLILFAKVMDDLSLFDLTVSISAKALEV